jgi:hypothetical protein
MRFVQGSKVVLFRTALPHLASNPNSAISSIWRTERCGSFGEYTVSGWRHADVAIWHVKVWLTCYEEPLSRLTSYRLESSTQSQSLL